MKNEDYVRSVYPRLYYRREWLAGAYLYTVYATRKGHHSSIVTFAAQGETEEELWKDAKRQIMTKTLEAFEN